MRTRELLPGTLLFLGALLVYVAASRGTISAIDLQIRYETARQIWLHGTTSPSAAQVAGAPDCYPSNAEGEHYSFYGIGQSITMLPAVAAADTIAARFAPAEREPLGYLGGQLIFQSIVIPLIAALAVLACFRLGLALGFPSRLAVGTAIAFGFATYWPFYVKTSFHNLELTTCLLGSLALLFPAREPVGPRSALRLALAGVLLGWTLQYRQEALLLVAPIWAIGLAALRRRGELRAASAAAWTLPVVLSGLGALLHNFARTGSFLGNPYRPSLGGWKLWTDAPLELAGHVTVGLDKGILWYSPILALGLALLLPGIPGRLRFGRAEAAFALPVGIWFAFVASLERSRDDWAWGPRFLLPILPFLVLGLASIARERFANPRVASIATGALIALSLLQAALCFDSHETEVLQTIRAHGKEGVAHAIPAEGIEGPLASPLAGRLRNLGVPLPDAPGAVIPWSDPRIRAHGRPLEGNLWWLKLASMPEFAPLRLPILGAGPLCALLGILALAASFRRARCTPVGSPAGALGEESGVPLPACAPARASPDSSAPVPGR